MRKLTIKDSLKMCQGETVKLEVQRADEGGCWDFECYIRITNLDKVGEDVEPEIEMDVDFFGTSMTVELEDFEEETIEAGIDEAIDMHCAQMQGFKNCR